MVSYQLVAKSGPTAGNVLALDRNEMFLGRDLNNDIVINDPEVSRRHARFFLQGKTYVLEDLGSTNGTTVNGQRLMGPYILKASDNITLGETINLTYEINRGGDEVEATLVMEGGDSTAKMSLGDAEPYYSSPIPEPMPFQGQPYEIPAEKPQYQPSAYAGNIPYQPGPGDTEGKKKFPTIVVLAVVLILLVICICAAIAFFAPTDLWCSVDIFGFFASSCL